MSEATALSGSCRDAALLPRSARPGAASLFLIGMAAILLCVPDRLLADPDTYWHVALGERIWSARALPWTDTFSHTFAGAPWIAKEWLSQLLLFAARALGGWGGVTVLASLAAASAFALQYGWLRARIQPTAALALTLVGVVLAAPHLLARPHLLAFPVILVWIRGLVAAAEQRSAPAPWLFLVMVPWANLHAGFTIGLVLAGLLALEAVVAVPGDRRAALALRWGAFLLAALVAGCATPYGHRSMVVTLTLFGSGEPLRYIQEWQPLAPDLVGCLAVAATVLLLAVLALDPRRNAVRIAIVALLGAMMIRHSRFLDLFALAAPLVACGPLVRRFPSLAKPAPPASATGAAAMLTAVALILLVGLGSAAGPRPSPGMTPEAALNAARAVGLTAGRVYNDYDFGGYLIAEGVPTFIDGRSDQIFLGGFTHALHAAVAAPDAAAFAGLLDRYGVTWALVRRDSRETEHLNRLAWKPVHADAVAAVFARP